VIRGSHEQGVEELPGCLKNVIPVKTGIQEIIDFASIRFLDTGFRRCDEQCLNSLSAARVSV